MGVDILTMLQALAGMLIVVVVALATAALLASRKIRIESEERTFYDASKETMRKSLADRAAKLFEGSGVPLTANEIVNLWGAATLVPPMAVLALGGPVVGAIAAAVCGFLLPVAYLSAKKRKMAQKFGDDLGQVLPLVASNLKGGLSLRQALTPVGDNMDEPIKGEFSLLAADIDRGMPVEVALVHMGERNKNNDVMLLASAVSAQRETGGNLADIIDTVAKTVQVRTMIRRDIRAKTSQARATAKVLAAIPIGLLVIMCGMNALYREFYLSPAGWAVIGGGLVIELIGFAMMRKMADIQAD